MITSKPNVAATAALRSPPRNWPASFKENKTLHAFLNKTLKAKKARLTSSPAADIVAEAAACAAPFGEDAATNAERIHADLGWHIVRGFAIYEHEDAPDSFVAKAHAWNAHPRNIWVDMTPRTAGLCDVLLVEADVEAVLAAAGVSRAPAVAVDISDSPEVATLPAEPDDASAPSAAVEAPAAAVAIAAPAAAKVDEAAVEAAPMSYDDILASLSLGPKASGKAGKKAKRRAPYDPSKIVATFNFEGSVKGVWVGSEGNEKLQKTRWPEPHSHIRLRMRADNRFELEASCWSKAREDDDEFIAFGCGQGKWFGPIEHASIDPNAAKLMVTGMLGASDRLTVHTVEELRNGKRKPPLTKDDIYRLCGHSLTNSLEWWRKGQSLTITLERNADWKLRLRQEISDWASDDDDV